MNKYLEAVDEGSSFLMHYGILGMQWGVRRYQNEDGTMKGLAKEGSWEKKTNSSGSYEDNMKSDAMAANGGGTLARDYSTYRNENCSICSVAYEMRRRGYNVTAQQCNYISPVTEAYEKQKPVWDNFVSESQHDPDYKNSNHYEKKDFVTKNANYVAAPLETAYTDYMTNHTVQDLSHVYENVQVSATCGGSIYYSTTKAVSKDEVSKFEATLISQGEGARGEVSCAWANSCCGHSMSYEIHDGKFYLIDGQSGEVFTGDDIYDKRLGLASGVAAYRLDQLKIKEDYVKQQNLVTNQEDAKMNWKLQSIAKDKTLNDLEIEQAKPYTESLMDKAYIFFNKQKNDLARQIKDIRKKAEKDLENAQNFISGLFK